MQIETRLRCHIFAVVAFVEQILSITYYLYSLHQRFIQPEL